MNEPPENHTPATLLVVDDTPANLGVVVTGLEAKGFRVVIAQDGEEAIRRAAFVRPDLILLDVMMPEVDGFATCHRLKSDTRTADIPVIFMTALADTESKVAGFAAGGVDYVTKPFEMSEVLARIDTHISLRRAQARLVEGNRQLQLEIARRRHAEDVSRSKSEFLANMSHEFRTPLNAILGFADAMLQEVFGPLGSDRYMAYAQDIHASGARLLTLVSDILDMAKIEAGRFELVDEIFDCDALVDETVQIFRRSATENGISVTIPAAGVARRLCADRQAVKQVMVNLLSNAVKFTPAGGAVTVRTEVDADGLTISVADTGIGIAAADIPRVTDLFTQVDGSISRRHGGIGLGLALSKSLIELHGGSLDIASRPGTGTTVSVHFPSSRLIA